MRAFIKIILITILISGCAGKSSNDKKQNDSISKQKATDKEIINIETIIGTMTLDDLENKSSSFIRYSRNQYFAKKGYAFNDSNLATFFNNQDWYSRASNQSFKLDSADTRKVEQLKSIEDNYGTVEYMRIIYKFNYNGFPLYYIAWDPQTINNEPNEFFDAGFAILDTSMLWTMDCSTIPPEYLKFKSEKFIDLIDDSYYVRKGKIEFKNIDKGCKGGEYDEIIIHLEGPSDDYNDVILGFNNKGEFSVLFDEFITIDNIVKINDSTLEFSTTKRCDFIGTMFCDKKYQYNTITKKVVDLPYDFDKVEMITRNRDKVELYSSPQTAINKLKDSIIGYLQPETDVEITRFLNKDDCYMIKTDSLTGWINDYQLQGFMVSFAD